MNLETIQKLETWWIDSKPKLKEYPTSALKLNPAIKSLAIETTVQQMYHTTLAERPFDHCLTPICLRSIQNKTETYHPKGFFAKGPIKNKISKKTQDHCISLYNQSLTTNKKEKDLQSLKGPLCSKQPGSCSISGPRGTTIGSTDRGAFLAVWRLEDSFVNHY